MEKWTNSEDIPEIYVDLVAGLTDSPNICCNMYCDCKKDECRWYHKQLFFHYKCSTDTEKSSYAKSIRRASEKNNVKCHHFKKDPDYERRLAEKKLELLS